MPDLATVKTFLVLPQPSVKGPLIALDASPPPWRGSPEVSEFLRMHGGARAALLTHASARRGGKGND
jgi:hypothetical protein